MSEKTVIVKLTLAQAEELSLVAGNGWGDGDFYNLNNEHTEEDRKKADLFCAARDRLRAAIQKAKRQ